MADRIIEFFSTSFGGISPNALVFWISMFPIVELRGGILAGYGLGLPWGINFLMAFLGNMIPIPFILAFIMRILRYLKKTRFRKIVCAIENKARGKEGQIKKGAYLGLFAFVAIPFPGTGAWTGALIASLLKMNRKKTLITITLGVLAAGVIMCLISYGMIDSFRS